MSDHRTRCERLSGGQRGALALAFVVLSAVLPVDALPDPLFVVVPRLSRVSAAPASYREPYVWGGRHVTTTPYGQNGALTVGSTALSTASPAGGGTIGATVDESGPLSKLRNLTAFGGGAVQFFGEGGNGRSIGHVLAAVTNLNGEYEVWAWGNNTYGQLGRGDAVASALPVKASWTPTESGEVIIELAAGERHSLMLTLKGTTRRVYAWGSNQFGQTGVSGLAVSSATKQTTPRLVSVLTSADVVSIAAGQYHSLAADVAGNVWVWGRDGDTYGNLGTAGAASRVVPHQLTSALMAERITTAVSYSITSNVITVNTDTNHYFEKGETASVSLGLPLYDGSKALSKITSTSFSYTAQDNVSLTATTGGTVTYTNGSATVTNKVLASNIATLTVGSGHNFKVGNVVTVNIGDPAFDGQRTLTGVGASTIVFRSQGDEPETSVASATATYSPSSANVTNKVLSATTSSSTATLTVGTGHNFRIGNVVTVNIGDPAFDGVKTITSASTSSGTIAYTAQNTISSTLLSPNGTVTVTSPTSSVVTNRVLTAPTAATAYARLTVPSNHGFKVGNIVDVDITGANEASFDGRHTITAVGSTYVDYARANISAVSTGATSGTVTLVTQSLSASSYSVNGSNVATIDVGAGHGLAVGNVIVVDGIAPNIDGTKTITVAPSGGTTVSFQAQASVASAAASGTVVFTTPSFSVTKRQVVGSTNYAYLTVGSHDMKAGNAVVVDGVDALLDGTKTLASVDATRIIYTAQPNVVSEATTGTAEMSTPSLNVTHRQIVSNYAYLTLGTGHGFVAGNTVNVAGIGGNFEGVKTILAVDGTRIWYLAQPNVALTTLSTPGSASITSCSVSCPAAPSGIVEVAAGHGFSLARSSSGSVSTWGFVGTNNYGRIGRTNTTVLTPSAVTLPSGCVANKVTAAPYGGVVVCADKRLTSWGYNGYGNLGTNVTSTSVTAPAVVATGAMTLGASENVADVRPNASGALVLTSTGRLFSWGRNYYRLLGTTSTYSGQNLSRTPVAANRIVPAGSATITNIHSDMYSSLVLDSAGKVWSWGYAASGMLGRGAYGPNGADGARFYSIGLPSTARIAHLDTTYYGTVAVMSDESVWSLGSNGGATTTYFNGDGTAGSSFLPGRVDLPYGFDTSLPSVTTTQLSCGSFHCLVATSNGSIYGWGDGAGYQLVLNSTTDRSTPTLIKSGLTNPRIAAGTWFSLYVDIGATGTGGTVYAWGSNLYRRGAPQSSSGTLTTFTAVQDTIASNTPSDVVAISAGTYHSIALRVDGSLLVWGANLYGQLGRGDVVTSYVAKPSLPGGRVAANVHAAANHTLVVATDGQLVGWGYNTNGVLASGNTTQLTSPTLVASGHTFRTVDTAGYHTTKQVQTAIGLTTNGNVLAWGSNVYGQLGRLDRPAASSGVNSFSAIPVSVQTSAGGGVEGVDAVVASQFWSGAYHRTSSVQAPSPPLDVSATSPTASRIDVSWNPPSSPRDLTGYVIHVVRDGELVFSAGAGRSATTLSMTAPTFDILNGREHTVVVHAVNEAGQSDASNSSAATPVSVPGSVGALEAAPILNGTRVDFDAPTDNGGSPVLDYEIEVVTVVGSTRAAIQTVSHPVPAEGVDITAGLSAGTEYVVKVRARNTNGFGPVETSSVVVPGRPTAPRDVAVASGDTTLSVSWSAPLHDGGVAIASYVATAYAVGTTTVVGTPAVVTSGLSGTITSLVNGTTYDVRVVASHDVSGANLQGLESETEKGVPGRPTPPTNVTATATASQTLTITWSRVDNVPGITVAGYRVKLVGSTTTEVNYTGCATSTCTYTATGLTNGTDYTVSVAGYVSGPAYGLFSDTVTARAMGPAGAPTVEAEAASQSAVVSITAPASTGGTPITGYTVSVSPTPTDAYDSSLAADPSPFTITGLSNGTTYTVTVRTVNEMGQSSAGTTTVVPSEPPSAPRNVRARPGSIIVTWDPPASTGGASVSHYVISVTDSDGVTTQFSTATSNPTGTSSCTTAGRSCTVNSVYTSESPETLVSIPNDMEYRVDVTAVNVQGTGDPSSAYVLISGQPDMPTNVEARGGVASIEMCWTPPTGTLTAYQIDLGRGSSSATVTVEVASLAAPSWCTSPKVGHVFTADDDGVDVVVGSVHTLSVKATVSSGDYVFGVSSAEVEATPYDVPGAPSIITISTTATTATVTWNAAAPRGSEVTGYLVSATPTGDTCTWSSGPLTCTFVGLVGNDTYGFSVEALNAAGTGPASTTVNATIDATKPSPVWGAPEMGSNRRLAYSATFDETIYYTVTFDEAVTGFALADGDISNSGTAPNCVFALTARSARIYDLTALCGGAGTLVVRISADSVVDTASNTGPLLDVDAAQVTLYDPSTTSTVVPTTVAPTSTTSPASSGESSTTTTSTIDEDERASASRATTTTNPSTEVAATTVPPTSTPPRIADDLTQQLPPEIGSRLPDEKIATPERSAPGQDVTLEKCGFDPGEKVRVYVGSSVVDRAVADSRGCVSIEITIDNSSSGRLEVALYGTTSKTGAKTTLFVDGRLTATGWSQQWWIVFGAVALVLGATVASMSRRRRTT